MAVAAGCLMAAAGGAQAQQPTNRVETWAAAGTAGWSARQGAAAVANPGAYLSVTFPSQAIPEFSADVASAPVAGGIRVTNIRFRVKASTAVPSACRLYLRGASGRVWQLGLPAVQTGAWTTVSARARLDRGWFRGPAAGSAAEFQADLGSVAEVGLYLRRHMNAAAQQYAIDDFQLQGLATGPGDRDGDTLPDAWEMQYGFDPDEPEDASADTDGDRMSNAAEWLAGTDPADAASRLELRAALTPAAGGAMIRPVELHWTSRSNRLYRVLRSRDPAAPYEPVVGIITGTPPENVYRDAAATNAVRFFYRLEVQP